MSRTNIDIDDALIERVMQWYGFTTKREAVDFALKNLIGGELKTQRDMLDLEGSGWEGDLEEMRTARDFLIES